MAPTLLVPTFNGRPIGANSSFGVEGQGVLPERADAWRASLDEATAAQIEALSDICTSARRPLRSHRSR
jgi:hypothetical protein